MSDGREEREEREMRIEEEKRKNREDLVDRLVDVELLMFAGTVKRITKKFAQRTDCYKRSGGRSLHMASFYEADTILSTTVRRSKSKKRELQSENADFIRLFQSALTAVGC